ncbi:MAG TPA: CsgG/HfaB family protein [Kiritimatiellia bacterium]|nr:CsgG/HfaB family protein [Kiritimatiellia bacterium]
MKSFVYLSLMMAGLMVAGLARAEEAGAGEAEATPEKVAPKIAVITPEQIDGEWYWYAYGGGQQHIVQSAIEKALLRNNVDILDVTALGSWRSLDDLIGARTAATKGKELGADYVIAGKATAVKASEGSAYGVNVIRANAEVTLRLIRVSDGKVLAVEDASAQAGGQAVRAAGQEALKQAGNAAARKIAAAVRTATGE